MRLDRRRFLASGAAATMLSALPRFAWAAKAASDSRFLLVLLRGGMDGLEALQPIGDPAFATLRGRFANDKAQQAATRISADFALHGKLGFMAERYARAQLLPLVAVAPPYQRRSHFQGQDCVENGTAGSGRNSGWLNRCVAALPGAGGLAIGTVTPLAMRGSAQVATWSPPFAERLDPLLWQRLQVLYAADPALARTFAAIDADATGMGGSAGKLGRAAPRLQQSMAAAARFMSAPHGARIAFVEDGGWDTHSNQVGALNRKLGDLDAGLRAFHDGAQSIWDTTVVAVVTEFGRTAEINGTGGTDHGTGGTAFLLGGAVNGGRVAGDFPGLARSQLNEGRDMRATTDMRALFKGVLSDHLGIADAALGSKVFPDSDGVAPTRDLIRQT